MWPSIFRDKEGHVEFAGDRCAPVLDRDVRHRPEARIERIVVDDIDTAVAGSGLLDPMLNLKRVSQVDWSIVPRVFTAKVLSHSSAVMSVTP